MYGYVLFLKKSFISLFCLCYTVVPYQYERAMRKRRFSLHSCLDCNGAVIFEPSIECQHQYRNGKMLRLDF